MELPDDHQSTSTANTRSSLEKHQDSIALSRKRAREAQEFQAQRMVKRSKRVFPEAEVGDSVTVPIPAVDRGRCDPRNLMGVIKDKDKNGLYTIVVKSGILQGKYARNQFDVCAYAMYTLEDMNEECTISLRTTVKKESRCGGQGFVKCNCKGNKRCQTSRCSCFKASILCNSRCHASW
jgi:hypothetical protein